MSVEYPNRPKIQRWIRYLCMAFAIANIFGGISAALYERDLFILLVALLIGGAWFAFGKYGGLPLVETVSQWRPAVKSNEITELHLQGLLVMCRRRWFMLASIPSTFSAAFLLFPLLMRISQPQLILFVLAVPIVIFQLRYWLSRCPRCGYGYFTRSECRAATLWPSTTCGHCHLSLYAYKSHLT
jgi:hypothetical protein